MQARSIKVFGLLLTVVIGIATSAGCGKSDAAKMEEYRKLAIKRDHDEEETTSAAVTPNEAFTPPPRAGSATPHPHPTPQNGTAAPAVASTTISTQPSAKMALGGGLSDTKAPPVTPLSEVERRQLTIDNMTKISNALEAYRASKGGGSYPAQFIGDNNGKPLLSWRVFLLPYLGYDDLFKQFRLNERYDSAHNQKLIEYIPAIYQSPERFDYYTNYLVPVGGSAAFNGAKPKPIRRWEDGLENSIILIEAGHDVLWTDPTDHPFDPKKPMEGLGGIRSDGFFAVWGGGDLTLVPDNGGNVRNAFTIDSGDIISSSLKSPAMATMGGIEDKFNRNAVPAPAVKVVDASSVPLASSVGPQQRNVKVNMSSSGPSALTVATADAQEAFSQGREADAIRLYYAHVATSEEASSWQYQYQWIPGLSRPAAIVRYGIAVEFQGKRSRQARVTALKALSSSQGNTSSSVRSQATDQAFGKLAGGFGRRVLKQLTDRPLHSPFIVEEPAPTERRYGRDEANLVVKTAYNGAMLAPGVQFIGVENERTLIAAARKHEVDVLLIFQIDEKTSTKGALVREVRLAVIDVIRKKTIFKTQELNSLRVQAAKVDLVADDPTPAVVDAFAEFVSDELTPVPFPASLRPGVAAKRVERLAAFKEKNPLRTLAEIKLYRQLGLIDLEQQMTAYSNLLDQGAGLMLIAGSPSEKAEALEPYLPRLSPSS